MKSLLVKINQIFPDLNQTERKIAQFILNNPYNLLNCSILELAEKTGVSQAAWVRFCKSLGFTGLKEVKREMNSSLISMNNNMESKDDKYSDTKGDGTIADLCRRVYNTNMQSITETHDCIDLESLELAADRIIIAKKIAFYGVGASGLVAMDAQYKFIRIGINAIAFMDLHLQLTSSATLESGDVAVIISNTGNTSDTMDVTATAKEHGATIIGITKYGKNMLMKEADIVLNTSTPEISIRSGAMGSRIAQLTIIDFLFAIVANKKYPQIEKLLIDSRRSIDERKA